MTTTSRFHRSLAVAATAMLVVGLGACGDDDDDAAAASGDDEPTSETTAAESGGSGGSDTEAYCAAEVTFEQISTQTGGPDEDPVASAQTLLDAVSDVRPLAPEEVAPQFDEAIAILEGVVGSGDPSALEGFDPLPIHQFDLQHCDWSVTDVTAADYSFDGLPETLDAGVHSFEVLNEGAEPHVMLVFRKADGVTDSWDDILAGDFTTTDKAEGVTAAFAPPGAPGYGVADLKAGEYLVFCPIPTGSGMETEGDGPPHFMNGMRQELTVE